MTVGDQGEKDVRFTEKVNKVIVEYVSLLLQSPDNPRIKAVIACPVCDIGDTGQQFAVNRNAWGLNSKVVQAADETGWFYPSGVNLHPVLIKLRLSVTWRKFTSTFTAQPIYIYCLQY